MAAHVYSTGLRQYQCDNKFLVQNFTWVSSVKWKDTSKSISLEEHNFEKELPQVIKATATQQLHFVSKLNGNKQILLDTRKAGNLTLKRQRACSSKGWTRRYNTASVHLCHSQENMSLHTFTLLQKNSYHFHLVLGTDHLHAIPTNSMCCQLLAMTS